MSVNAPAAPIFFECRVHGDEENCGGAGTVVAGRTSATVLNARHRSCPARVKVTFDGELMEIVLVDVSLVDTARGC